MYPEGLNSAMSSGTQQRTDRHHGIVGQQRSHLQCNSYTRAAERPGPCRAHWPFQKQRASPPPGHGSPRSLPGVVVVETEAGRTWLIRLMVATLLVFGLKRGVGAETLSEFFGRLRLDAHVGCSPSALRTVMHMLERFLLETAAAWEQDGIAHGEIRPVIGAVDETFLQRMMLVFMDLATGYVLMEEVAADRSYHTWFAR